MHINRIEEFEKSEKERKVGFSTIDKILRE